MKKTSYQSTLNFISTLTQGWLRRGLRYVLALALLIYGVQGADGQTASFTTAGAATWTCPCGVTSVEVQCWGAGGGGGAGYTTSGAAGGGGAGGGFAQTTSFTVVPGTTYYINVGAGGAGGASGAAAPGGVSWFNTTNAAPVSSATGVLAVGGNQGTSEATNTSGPGGAAVSTGNINAATNPSYYGGAGGNGASGTIGGGGGSSGGTAANGNAGTNTGTAGAAVTGGGAGGAGKSAATGTAGSAPGGGGGGARANNTTARNGGAGGNGQVVLTYTVGVPTITSLSSSSGCTGSTLTINGTNFCTVSAVTIGGTNVTSFNVVSATQITAVVGSTSGNVQVVAAGGTVTGSSFTILTTPSTVTVTPYNTTQCGGTVTLTASGGTGGTVYWQGTNSGGTSTALGGSPQTVSASGTYYFSSYNGSCWSPPGNATVNITVPPAAPTVLPASPTTICSGNSVGLTGTSSGNNINWWTAATGGTLLTTVSSGTAYTVSPTSTTTYYAEAATIPVTGTATLTTTGTTWTVPAGVTSATFYMWGGGGGGGGGTTGGSWGNGGGGGGSACGYVTIPVFPGDVYTVTIGAGGIAGTATANGGTGGTTTFTRTTTAPGSTGTPGPWTVLGGAGGTHSTGGGNVNNGGAGSTSGTGTGIAFYAGGTGSAGNDNTGVTGTGGGAGGSGAAGTSPSSACSVAGTGGTGTYPGGNGGYNTNCSVQGNKAGTTFVGAVPGGGGAGDDSWTANEAGGPGGAGEVIIVFSGPSACPSASRTPLTVNVLSAPTAVTVTPAVTNQCGGSVTLTATGGTGGTIYWENTTSGGTSTALGSSPQTVSASGTYYFNAYNGSCWGAQGVATVFITTPPAAPTASSSLSTICAGNSLTLTGTAAGDNINWYTTATGGTPLTTVSSGTPYTVSPATSTTYYAEAATIPTSGTATLTTTGSTWTVPAGVTSATFYMWGGGGGGGGGTTGGSWGNGGAGGGSACGYATITVFPGDVYTATIGAGGTAGSATANGGTGGTTTFTRTTTAIGSNGASGPWTVLGASGGTHSTGGGNVNAGGAGSTSGTGTGISFYAGGSGSAGNDNTGVTGTGGGAGGSGSVGTSPSSACGVTGTGGTGTYPGGNGSYNVDCGTSTNLAGTAGSVPGGGGGADDSWTANEAGGAGGAGEVIVAYTGAPACVSTSRTAVPITVLPSPGAISITPPVTAQCGGSVTLTATGGSGGTIYYQGTTNGGTSTALGGSPQTVSTSGNYYFNAYNGTCWGAQAQASVSITTVPSAATAATATPASICPGQSTSLSATSAGNDINWWTAASGGTLLGTVASGAGLTVTPTSNPQTYYAEATTVPYTSPTVITASGTWTVPPGVTSITVSAWGGGGAGGGANSAGTPTYSFMGAGGGGGACSANNTVTVNPGDVYTVTIGAGGTAGTGNGGNGGTTTFTGPAGTLTAAGGTGGAHAATTAAAGVGATTGTTLGTGGVIYSGGNGSIGQNQSYYPGSGGGGAGSGGNGAAAAGACGGGGAGGSGTYAGGAGGFNNNGCNNFTDGNGVAGGFPGGGGSGEYDELGGTNYTGGAGAAGEILISFTPPSACVAPTRTPVTVSSLPYIQVTPSASYAIECGAQPVAMSATATPPTTYNSYTWSPTTGLYTNAAGTTAYTGGTVTAGTTIYANPTTNTQYTVSGVSTASSCTVTQSSPVIYNVVTPVTVVEPTLCAPGSGSITVTPVSATSSIYTSNFSSGNAGTATIGGTGSPSGDLITGSTLQLTADVTSQNGYIQIPQSTNSNSIQASFTLTIDQAAGNGADGISYTYGTNTAGAGSENGAGYGLKVCFDSYNNGTVGDWQDGANGNLIGIYVVYGAAYTAATSTGVVAYSGNTNWTGSTNNIVISVNASGQLTLTIGGTAVFTNLQLPAAYLTDSKSGWYHTIGARTGGVSESHIISNVVISSGATLPFTPQYDLNTGAWQTSPAFTGLSSGGYTVNVRDASNPSCATTIATENLALPAALSEPAPTAVVVPASSYCGPSGLTSGGGTSVGDWIRTAVLNGTTNTTTTVAYTANAYNYVTTNTYGITAGTAYTLTGSIASDYTDFGGGYDEGVEAWIDYNHDGVFESNEVVNYVTKTGDVTSAANMTYSLAFTVPASAISGTTRMRIMLVSELDESPPLDPCASAGGTYYYGQAQDYNVTITGGTSASCGGLTTYQLTSSPTGGTAPYTYSWSSVPAGFTSAVSNPTVVPTANTTYTCTVTDACSATAANSVAISGILPAPTVLIGSVPASGNFCTGGAAVALTASGANTYSWSPTTSMTPTTGLGATVSVSPTSSTTYTVTGVATNTCYTTVATTVNVYAPPTINAGNPSASVNPVCPGSPSQLNVVAAPPVITPCIPPFGTSAGYGCSLEYIYDFSVKTSGGANVISNLGAGGCYVNGNTYNNLGGTYTSGNLVAGNTYTVNLQDLSDNYVSYTVWIDYNQDGIFEANELAYSSQSQGIDNATSYTGTFTVPLTAINGTLNVMARADWAVWPTTGCGAMNQQTGEIQNYTVTLTGGTSPTSLTYMWSPSTSLNFSNIVNPVATPLTATTYNVTVTYPVTGCVATGSVNVATKTSPTAVLSGASSVCAGSSIALTVTATGTGPFSGTLSTGKTFSGATSPITVLDTPSVTTVYTITALNDANCSALPTGLTGRDSVTITTRPTAQITGGATSVCLGATELYTVSFTGTAPWTYTIDTSGGTFSGTTGTSPITFQVSPHVSKTIKVSALHDASCTSVYSDLDSENVAVTTGCTITWVGTTSSNWNTASNWNPILVPDACSVDVVIPAGTPNSPVISTNNIQVGNLTIASPQSITLNGYNLSVCKNLLGNYGVYLPGSGNLVFDGSVPQNVTGTIHVDGVVFDNTSTPVGSNVVFTNYTVMSVYRGASLQAGNVNVTTSNAALTLLSTNVDSAAYLNDFTGGYTGTFTGNLIAHRQVAVTGTAWQHEISSPVNGATFYQMIQQGNEAYGYPLTDAYLIPSSNCSEDSISYLSPYSSAFTWNEGNVNVTTPCITTGWQTVGYNDSWTPGKGYSVYLNSGSNLYLEGQPNTGNISLGNCTNGGWSFASPPTASNPTSHTDNSGWSMVGNPYPSGLNISATSTGFDGQVQVFHPSGTYLGTYNPVQLTTSTLHLAPYQAFMAHKTAVGGTATWTFNQSGRTTNVGTQYQFYELSEDAMTIQVKGNGFADMTRLEFNAGATDGFDVDYDADKFQSNQGQPTLYTVIPGYGPWGGINVMGPLVKNTTVPLGMQPGADGTFTLSFDPADLAGFPASVSIYLEDKQNPSNWVNVRTTNSYTFTSKASDQALRFALHFSPEGSSGISSTNANASTDINIFSAANSVMVDFSRLQTVDATIQIYDVLGQQLSNEEYHTADIYSKAITSVEAAYVIVMVRMDDGQVTSKKLFLTK